MLLYCAQYSKGWARFCKMTTYTGQVITEAIPSVKEVEEIPVDLYGGVVMPPPKTSQQITSTQDNHLRRRFATAERDQTVIEGAISTVIGNYCGPYWSEGLLQTSVVGTAPALGPTDQACKIHDACYAGGNDLLYCDELMLDQPDVNPIVRGAISAQALARRLYRNMTKNTNKNNNNNNNNNKSSSNKNNAGRRILRKNQKNSNKQPTAMMQTAPAAASLAMANLVNAPRVSAIQRGVVVKHSEMIGSAFVGAGAPTAFNCVGLTINAGKFATFPWLAVMATSYDRYRFRKLSFSYVPLVPTSTSGRLGIGYDYDSSDAPPTTRQDFFSLTRHSEGAVWAPCALEVPVDNQIRFTNTHTTTDSKLIDLGQLIVLTDATSATASSAIGDIICEYEVELLDPQQPSYSTTLVTARNPADSAGFTVTGPASAYFKYIDSTHLSLGLSPGRYYVTTYIRDTAVSTPTVSFTYLNCDAVGSSAGISTTTQQTTVTLIACSGGSGTLTLTIGGAATWADLESLDFVVSKVSGDLTAPV